MCLPATAKYRSNTSCFGVVANQMISVTEEEWLARFSPGDDRLRIVVRPKCLRALALRGMDRFWSAERNTPTRSRKQFSHQLARVARNGDAPLDRVQKVGQLAVVLVRHLVAVCAIVAACGVDIGRIAIEECVGRVIEADDI